MRVRQWHHFRMSCFSNKSIFNRSYTNTDTQTSGRRSTYISEHVWRFVRDMSGTFRQRLPFIVIRMTNSLSSRHKSSADLVLPHTFRRRHALHVLLSAVHPPRWNITDSRADYTVRLVIIMIHTFCVFDMSYIHTSCFPAACLRLKRGRFEEKEHSWNWCTLHNA